MTHSRTRWTTFWIAWAVVCAQAWSQTPVGPPPTVPQPPPPMPGTAPPPPPPVHPHYLRVLGTVQHVDHHGRLLMVASAQGPLTFNVEHNAWSTVRWLHDGEGIRVTGHTRSDGQLAADSVVRQPHP